MSTSCCERGFSAMNRIKSDERSRMKKLLTDLIQIYTMNVNDYNELLKKTRKLSEKVVSKVWKKAGKVFSDLELEKSMMWI